MENRIPRWTVRVDLANIVDQDRVRVADSDPIGEPEVLETGKNARGRTVVKKRVVLERTFTQDPEVVGETHTTRFGFEFTNQLVTIHGKERLFGNVLLRTQGYDRVNDKGVDALTRELDDLKTHAELLALLKGKGFDTREQREKEFPPLAGRCSRARDILRVGYSGISEKYLENTTERRFPVDMFLRMQTHAGEIVWQPRRPYLAQGLALSETGGKSGNFTKPTKIVLAKRPQFHHHQVDGRWIPESIVQPGWLMVLDGEEFNRINRLYFWAEQRVREFASYFTALRPVVKTEDRWRRASNQPKAAATPDCQPTEATHPPASPQPEAVPAANPPATPPAEPTPPTEQPSTGGAA